VPVVAVVIGEGGSGGALALGVADRVLMLENAIYSVISPEGCAAILWKSASAKDKAAEALRLTAGDLTKLDVVDEIVPEPLGGAHTDPDATAGALRSALIRNVRELSALDPATLRTNRWQKYEALGAWREVAPGQTA
ncbi:MAG: acetyl-CoA carboxylase carboxyl transferase subunit alpha, partial [Longimicrobiales bacterium]